MGLDVSCAEPRGIVLRLCDRGLVEAPASLHFSIYSGDELLCAGIAESPVMPGDCVPAPCALDPDELGVPLAGVVNDGEPPVPECVTFNNEASFRGCD